jgi:lipoyl(octanoyl) transferase
VAAVLPVLDLGIVAYEPLQQLQGRLRRAVAERRLPGVLMLLEHEAVITLGNRGGPGDLRGDAAALGVAVFRSERGGAATLHAPGQLVSYPVMPLPRRELHRYVLDLEEVVRLVLARYGISAERREKKPGLYVGENKICSLGLRCERWVASHGTSLNVDIDLELFGLIVSCGEEDLRQTSMRRLLGYGPDMDEVKAAYRECFAAVFGRETQPLTRVEAGQVEEQLRLGMRAT